MNAPIVEEVLAKLRTNRAFVRNNAADSTGLDDVTAFCQQIINAPRDPHEAAFADVIRTYYNATLKIREREGEAKARKKSKLN